jgi:hypothetical protein
MQALNKDAVFGEVILNDLFFISTNMSPVISYDFYEMNGKWLIDIKRWDRG